MIYQLDTAGQISLSLFAILKVVIGRKNEKLLFIRMNLSNETMLADGLFMNQIFLLQNRAF